MQHSKRSESFCMEEEHFFESYGAEPVNAQASLTFELDTVDAHPPTARQLAHFTRFRRPVAWVMAAMGSLSLVALGQHVLQQSSRREVVTHRRSAPVVPAFAAAKTQANPVNDFTSALLSMCRDARC